MIEEKRIKRNLKDFAFPRLSGTKFELKAFNKLKNKVESLKLDYDIQNFTFSTFYSRIYPKIAFSSGSLIFLTLFLTFHPIMSPILLIVLISVLTSSFLLTRKPEKIQFVSKLNSQNMLIKIKATSDTLKIDNKNILFISHLDSKGQRFKMRIRIKTIKVFIGSSFFLIIILPLKILNIRNLEVILYIIALFPLSFNIASSIIILFNSTNNSSEGAVDNASGIVCNLELLNYYNIKENRLANYNIWFLFTGAEECGTMGIRHFYNNLKNYNREKSLAFNFESIARRAFLFPGGKEGDNALDIDHLILNNTRNLKINHYFTNRVLGTHSDGGFLGNKGFQGYGIGGVEPYQYMHTPNDSLDKVNTEILRDLCLVLTDSLKKHDSTFFD